MIRFALVTLALLAPFMFPWQAAALLIFLAATGFPILALLGGVLMDVLYFAPGAAALPWGTVIGILGFLAALFVQDFMKTRIMGA
jgi:hypothetical protein